MSFLCSFDQLTIEEKLTKAVAILNREMPFFARILLAMQRHKAPEKSKIPTMGVNQYGHLYYNEKWVSTLSMEEIEGTLCHECCHVAFLTFQRQKNRDLELWNIATDIAINWVIVSSKLVLPPGVLLPQDDGTMKLPLAGITINVKDLPAEKIYELLEKHAEKVKANYSPMDTHIPGNGDGDGGDCGEGDNDEGEDKTSTAPNKANLEKWKEVCAGAAATAKNRGKTSSAIERAVDGILSPKLNWKELLNRYITRELPYNYTYNRPGKKSYASGFYMPSVLKENMELVITCDVSGSISPKEYNEFMSEVLGIVNSYEQVRARVLFWSTLIDSRDDRIVDRDNANDLLTYTAHSSGGTAMNCVAEYMQENNIETRIAIHLTDGYIESNPILPNCVNICVITTNGSSDILSKTDAILCSLNDDGE